MGCRQQPELHFCAFEQGLPEFLRLGTQVLTHTATLTAIALVATGATGTQTMFQQCRPYMLANVYRPAESSS